jgi:ABC-2 type transport system permease protein
VSESLRFEWVRLRTIRSTSWLIASGLALSALAALLFAYGSRGLPRTPEIVAEVATAGGASLPLPLLAAFVAVVGILATGHDYRYGTIQPTLTAMPQRTPLLLAKVVVAGATAVPAAVVSLALNLLAGFLVWGEFPDLGPPPLGQILTGYVLLTLLWSIVGVALGQLFRGVPGPLVVILAVPMLVEQVILRLSFVPSFHWLAPYVKFLPFTAGMQLITFAGEASGGSATEVDMLARWPSATVFAVFTAAVLASALVLFHRRDA